MLTSSRPARLVEPLGSPPIELTGSSRTLRPPAFKARQAHGRRHRSPQRVASGGQSSAILIWAWAPGCEQRERYGRGASQPALGIRCMVLSHLDETPGIILAARARAAGSASAPATKMMTIRTTVSTRMNGSTARQRPIVDLRHRRDDQQAAPDGGVIIPSVGERQDEPRWTGPTPSATACGPSSVHEQRQQHRRLEKGRGRRTRCEMRKVSTAERQLSDRGTESCGSGGVARSQPNAATAPRMMKIVPVSEAVCVRRFADPLSSCRRNRGRSRSRHDRERRRLGPGSHSEHDAAQDDHVHDSDGAACRKEPESRDVGALSAGMIVAVGEETVGADQRRASSSPGNHAADDIAGPRSA